jgi:hypothetical protein
MNQLRNDCIEVKPIHFDFGRGYGETWDLGIDPYRDECQNRNCVDGYEPCIQCGGKDGKGGTGEIPCGECGGTGVVDGGVDGQECPECMGKCVQPCECQDAIDAKIGWLTCEECEGAGSVEIEDGDRWFPMMNYYYPIPDDSFEPPEDPWNKLDNCTIVRIGEQYALALTGGGMDLSWEICRTFVNLGYYPPVHFCNLPEMAGRGESEGDLELVRICREAAEMASNWDARVAARLVQKYGKPRILEDEEVLKADDEYFRSRDDDEDGYWTTIDPDFIGLTEKQANEKMCAEWEPPYGHATHFRRKSLDENS